MAAQFDERFLLELKAVEPVFAELKHATGACPLCLSARVECGSAWTYAQQNACEAGHKWLHRHLLDVIDTRPIHDRPLTVRETAVREDLDNHRKLTADYIGKFKQDIIDLSKKREEALEQWKEDITAMRKAVLERFNLMNDRIDAEFSARKQELEVNQQRLESQLTSTRLVYEQLFAKDTSLTQTATQSQEREAEVQRRGYECITGCPLVFQLGMRFHYSDVNKTLAMNGIQQLGTLLSDAIEDKKDIDDYSPIVQEITTTIIRTRDKLTKPKPKPIPERKPWPLPLANPSDAKRDERQVSAVVNNHTFNVKTKAHFVKLFQQLGRAYNAQFAKDSSKPKWTRKTPDSLTCVVQFADGRPDYDLGTVTFNSHDLMPLALWNASGTLLLLFPEQLKQYRAATESPMPLLSSLPALVEPLSDESSAAGTGEVVRGTNAAVASGEFAGFPFKKSYKLKVFFGDSDKPKVLVFSLDTLSTDVVEATEQMRAKFDDRVKDWGLAPGQYGIFHQETGDRVDAVTDVKAIIVKKKKLKFDVRKAL